MALKIRHLIVSFFIIGALVLGGCNPVQSTSQNSNAIAVKTSEATTSGLATAVKSAQKSENSLPRLEGKATVILKVKGAPITIEVDGDDAPITAGNFVDLVQRGVYNGLVFHRVIREPEPFVVQGGDPKSKDPNVKITQLGTGSFIDPATGQPRLIPLEIKPKGADRPIYSKTLKDAGITVGPKLLHTRGAVAMARSDFPDSASSQFYIALADLNFLDGDYAVFGYVKEGMDVVDQIQASDRIDSAKVMQGADNLKVAEKK